MKEQLAVLRNCPLFIDISEDEIKHLLSCLPAVTKRYQDNEFIFMAGDKIIEMGIILSGSIEIRKDSVGGSTHLLSVLGKGSLFGEGIVSTLEQISPVTVTARGSCVLLFIPYDTTIRTCSKVCSFHLQLIRNLFMILGEKNAGLTAKIELLMLKGMREKIATYLLLEQTKNRSTTFQISLNRNELAEYLNVSRTSMCRELSRMKDEKLIDYYKNSFRILSLDKLQETVQ